MDKDELYCIYNDALKDVDRENADDQQKAIVYMYDKITELKSALVNARASFLGLIPDELCPIRTQMAAAIRRINETLYEGDC